MSLRVIESLLGLTPARLDIGRERIVWQRGREHRAYPTRIPPGLPSAETLAHLAHGLSETLPPAQGKRRLQVTFSDALARSWISERPPGLAASEITALASAQMQQIYGDQESSDWAIQIDPTPFACRWPAMALPQSLVASVVAALEARSWQAAAIRTRFVDRLAHTRSNPFQIARNTLYCLDHHDGLTIGLCVGNEWRSLRTHPPLNLLKCDLENMLRRDCHAVGVAPEDCRITQLSPKCAEISP